MPEVETVTTSDTDSSTLAGSLQDAVAHVARCRQCDAGVKYQLTASGAGLITLEVYGMAVDTTLGIGDGGVPVCPNGHGEMQLEDEQLPAEDAIARVRGQLTGPLDPLQGTLPGIIPPFNYQGAYLELEQMAVECDRLKREHEDAASEARDAKKRWDKSAETYTKMALEFQRRRREKVAVGDPVADLDETRCTFERLNPDQDCPLCDGSIVDIEEIAFAPKNSAEHAEQAVAMLLTRAVVDLIELLEAGANMSVSEDVVRGWSADEREEVRLYAEAVIAQVDQLQARPKALGTMHVAGPAIDEAPQMCTQCDAVLVEDTEGSSFAVGTLVGTDCPGKPAEAHRYPKGKHAKKKAGKKG